MSADILTKFLEEYRELSVRWQVRSADYSNRAKRDESLDHISLLFLFFFRPNTPHSPSIITAAATCFDELILDTQMYGQSSGSAHACVVKYIRVRLPSQARRAGPASHTFTVPLLFSVSSVATKRVSISGQRFDSSKRVRCREISSARTPLRTPNTVDVFTVPLLRNGFHNIVVLLLLGADYIENTASSIVA
jgi:hypothetical protein